MSAKGTKGIVVGAVESRFGRFGNFFTKRNNIILACVVVALLCVGMIIWASGVLEKSEPEAAVLKPVTNASQVKTDDAYTYANAGDYDKAVHSLDETVSEAKNNDEKVLALFAQATLSSNAERYDEARGYALEAEKLAPSDATAGLLGDIAVAQDDKVGAQKYYTLAIERLDKKNSAYPIKRKTWTTKLEAVKS